MSKIDTSSPQITLLPCTAGTSGTDLLQPWAQHKLSQRCKSLLRNLWKSLLKIRNLVRLSQKSLWKIRNRTLNLNFEVICPSEILILQGYFFVEISFSNLFHSQDLHFYTPGTRQSSDRHRRKSPKRCQVPKRNVLPCSSQRCAGIPSFQESPSPPLKPKISRGLTKPANWFCS